MKVDFSSKFQGVSDDMTLGAVAFQALNAQLPGGQPFTLDQAVARGLLALKVRMASELDISPEEAALIRSGLPLVVAPFVVAQAAEMLR